MTPNNFKLQTTKDLALFTGAALLGGTAILLAGQYGGAGLAKVGSAGWNASKYLLSTGWYYTKASPFAVGRAIRWTAVTGWGATKWTVSTVWSAAKWTVVNGWSATKWTVKTGFSIAKYILVNIPAAIKWTALSIWGAAKWGVSTAWSLTKWGFSCIRHPIDSIVNAWNNTLSLMESAWSLTLSFCSEVTRLYEKYILDNVEILGALLYKGGKKVFHLAVKNVQDITSGIADTFPRLGSLGNTVKGYAVAFFGFTMEKSTAIAEKVLPYNPMPWVFEKAPSLQNPLYAAVGASAASFGADLYTSRGSLTQQLRNVRYNTGVYVVKDDLNHAKKQDARNALLPNFILMTIGTALLAPRVADYFSSGTHTLTRMQGTGWGFAYASIKGFMMLISAPSQQVHERGGYQGRHSTRGGSQYD